MGQRAVELRFDAKSYPENRYDDKQQKQAELWPVGGRFLSVTFDIVVDGK